MQQLEVGQRVIYASGGPVPTHRGKRGVVVGVFPLTGYCLVDFDAGGAMEVKCDPQFLMRESPSAQDLAGALRWLLDCLTDAGQNKAPDSETEYDSVAYARTTVVLFETSEGVGALGRLLWAPKRP